jgi:predicted HicB family RNase H-like nuclease
MRDEYDFADGQRGKFHRADVRLVPPVHLEPDVLSYLTDRAKDKGTSLNALVNELLKKDIELIKIGE